MTIKIPNPNNQTPRKSVRVRIGGGPTASSGGRLACRRAVASRPAELPCEIRVRSESRGRFRTARCRPLRQAGRLPPPAIRSCTSKRLQTSSLKTAFAGNCQCMAERWTARMLGVFAESNFRIAWECQAVAPHRGALRSAGLRPAACGRVCEGEIGFGNRFEIWFLGFLWSLELGAWSFSSCFR